jgi:DNA-binding NarL/FixJ family response regulator
MKVLIIDDHPLIREAVADALARLDEEVRVIQAGNLADAARAVEAHTDVTLILLDVMLPDARGTDAVRRVRQTCPGVPAVVLSAADDRATVLATLDCGAKGFISKRSTSVVLLGALRLVLAGETYIPPEVLGGGIAARATSQPAPTERAIGRTVAELGLTPRQIDVLTLLVQGKSTKLISRELRVATGTVKTHTAAIFRALGVSNRTQALFKVSRMGIELAVPDSRGAKLHAADPAVRTLAVAPPRWADALA